MVDLVCPCSRDFEFELVCFSFPSSASSSSSPSSSSSSSSSGLPALSWSHPTKWEPPTDRSDVAYLGRISFEAVTTLPIHITQPVPVSLHCHTESYQTDECSCNNYYGRIQHEGRIIGAIVEVKRHRDIVTCYAYSKIIFISNATLRNTLPLPWRPVNHSLFPPRFRQTVLVLLLCRLRLRDSRTFLGALGIGVMYNIIQFLNDDSLWGCANKQFVDMDICMDLTKVPNSPDRTISWHRPPIQGALFEKLLHDDERFRLAPAVQGAANGPWARPQPRRADALYAGTGPVDDVGIEDEVDTQSNNGSNGYKTDKERKHRFDVFQLLESVRPPKRCPEAPSPPDLASKLFPYQRRALAWMMAMEDGTYAVHLGPMLNPEYREYIAADGTRFYHSKVNPREFCKVKPTVAFEPQGGVLADEMGLGKTVETISLILSRPRPLNQVPTQFPDELIRLATGRSLEDEDDDATKRLKRRRRARQERELATSITYGIAVNTVTTPLIPAIQFSPIKTTLIISPQTIASQWLSEIERHTVPGALTVMHYNGMDGVITGETFGQYDVVLTSYETLRKEARQTSVTRESPLFHVQWWRVIVDEAQIVSNSATQASKVTSALYRINSWCVSGTPISNRVKDLFGLLQFLCLAPFDDPRIWSKCVLDPLEAKNQQPFSLVTSLAKNIMWRYRKKHVQTEISLPPCKVNFDFLPFSPLELSYYETRLKECRTALQTVSNNRQNGLSLSSAVMSLILNLRQTCCHPQIVKRSNRDLLGDENLSMVDIMKKVLNRLRTSQVNPLRDYAKLTIQYANHPHAKKTKRKELALLYRKGYDLIQAAKQLEKQLQIKSRISLPQARIELQALEGLIAIHSSDHKYGDEIKEWRLLMEPLQAVIKADEEKKNALQESIKMFEPRNLRKRKHNAAENTEESFVQHTVSSSSSSETYIRPPKRQKHTDTQNLEPLEDVEFLMQKAESKYLQLVADEERLAKRISEGASNSQPGPIVPVTSSSSVSAANCVCVLCREVMEAALVAPCSHMFCEVCILSHIESQGNSEPGAPCPICEYQITPELLVPINNGHSDMDIDSNQHEPPLELDQHRFGTKITHLLNKLLEIRSRDPTAKSVIFSQWNNFLQIIMKGLDMHHIQYAHLSGTHGPQHLERFRRDPECRVILVSMRSGGGAAGLTLTNARYGFIMEPSVNLAIEDQAIARLHRIGQQHRVSIYRILIDNTIEGKILKLQEKKNQNLYDKKEGTRDAKEALQTNEVLEMFDMESMECDS
eukprot:GILK01002718.1.p1 GENE.GILK01002718.1~~GILK01002718.1.p1  ORF type:complete len:1265 (-),score=217.34 GILK01002718.1:76-3870(-)